MTDIPNVTDIPNRQSLASSDRNEADAPFLRRILFGLITAAVLSGAVTIVLTSQHEFLEQRQIASTQGPA